MKAPLPANEAERLLRLHSYGLLDTPSEAAHERIVNLARSMFTVPMVAISLVDETRQWFKASCGMPGNEVKRDYSFCAHTILDVEVFVVRDAQKDLRFLDNPQVTGPPRLRFYAGAPLKTSDGFHLGSLCVLDTTPRRFTVAEGRMLADLAATVMDSFALRRTTLRLREEADRRERARKGLAGQHRTNRRIVSSWGERALARTTDLAQSSRCLCEEIARREQREIDLVRLDYLAEESQDLIGLATLDGRVTYINKGGRKLIGIDSLEEAQHTNILDYFPADKRAFVKEQVYPKLFESGRWESDFELRHFKTGAIIPVSWNVFLVRDPRTGEPTAIATVTRDITQRKIAEAAINQAREEAENANTAKSEFLYRMSHELRTPLNAILGFGQLLEMQAESGPIKDCSTHVVSAGRHLLNLINEVLDISRIESGHVELSLEPVVLAAAIAETLDLIRPLAHEREIILETINSLESRDVVYADRQRFKQVLLNLFSNAVKYSERGGRVVVSCVSGASGHRRVCIKDEGPGIAAEKLGRLFVPFERLGAEHSDVPGTGLGLALSKHLMEALNGSIGVESEPGLGSTFWVELPCVTPHHQSAAVNGFHPTISINGESKTNQPDSDEEADLRAVSPHKTTQIRVFTVLYIEDNTSNLRLVEHLIKCRPDVRLLTAPEGLHGLAVAGECQPDLILLDLHLPDMPGWEVIAHLKSSASTRNIPVVVVSADATQPSIDRLMQAGAQTYLTKPFDLDRVLRLLPERGSKAAERRV